MSEYGATQIPKPTDEQTFERCNEVLWRCILNDPTAQIYGRRGQRQHGVDILGYRDGDPEQPVGIQCKLRGEGRTLGEDEVRKEVEKALTFERPLTEYIIATTAPDDVGLQNLASELYAEIKENHGRKLKIRVFGWDSLQREIHRHPMARKAFDPSHTPQADRIEGKFDGQPAEFAAIIAPRLDAIQGDIASLRANDAKLPRTASDSEYHQLIDDYKELVSTDPGHRPGLVVKASEENGR